MRKKPAPAARVVDCDGLRALFPDESIFCCPECHASHPEELKPVADGPVVTALCCAVRLYREVYAAEFTAAVGGRAA